MVDSEDFVSGRRSEQGRVAIADGWRAEPGTSLPRCWQATAAESCKSRIRKRRRAEFVALATVSWSSCGSSTNFRETAAPAWLPGWGGTASGSRLPQARVRGKAPCVPITAAPAWDLVTTSTLPATVAALALGLWASSREDSSSQDEPQIQLDPGRGVLNVEWLAGTGRIIKDIQLDASGSLSVTAYSASKEPLPEDVPRFAKQEWRVLRFCPAAGKTNLVQSVTKVIVPPFPSSDKARLRPEALPLAYTKTLATVVLSTLAMLGVPISADEKQEEPPRVLCIGLGGGSVPSFIASALPHCQVDVAELEAPVLEAATEALGFHERPNLRVAVADGAAYAAEQLAMNDGGEGVYDAVLVDAYDAAGNVPADLREAGSTLVKALSQGLLRRRGGLVAANMLPAVDPVPILAAYRASLAEDLVGPGFTVRAPGAGNRMIVQVCADPNKVPQDEGLGTALGEAAISVQQTIKCPFAMKELAVNQLRTWSEWKELCANGWAEGIVEEEKSSEEPRSA